MRIGRAVVGTNKYDLLTPWYFRCKCIRHLEWKILKMLRYLGNYFKSKEVIQHGSIIRL